jgi:hypothetical protein
MWLIITIIIHYYSYYYFTQLYDLDNSLTIYMCSSWINTRFYSMPAIKQCDLKIAYWNIKGLKQSDGTLKTDDVHVQHVFKEHDIICLSEIQCSENDIPEMSGYSCLKQCRSINSKINRYFGGLSIYYRSELRPGIRFLKHKNNDYAWLKLCK